MKIGKIAKELRQSFGGDDAANCVVFWESQQAIRVSMFPSQDPESFANFWAGVAAIVNDPEKAFNEGQPTVKGWVKDDSESGYWGM